MKILHVIQGISLIASIAIIWLGSAIFGISHTLSLVIASLIIAINAGVEIFL